MTTAKRKTTVLKEAFMRKGNPVVQISAPTPFVAKMLERAGLEYAFIGGDVSISVMTGRPGLWSNLQTHAWLGKMFAEAVDIPVAIDADYLGSLGPVHAELAVQEFTKVGLAGMDMDDRIPASELGAASRLREGGEGVFSDKDWMVSKIKAANEARKGMDPDFVIRARCYARGFGPTPEESLEDNIVRLKAYRDAGADVLYLGGRYNMDEIKTVLGQLQCPITIPSIGGTTISPDLAKELGLCEVRYPYTVEQEMHSAAWNILMDFKERGLAAVEDSRERNKDNPYGGTAGLPRDVDRAARPRT